MVAVQGLGEYSRTKIQRPGGLGGLLISLRVGQLCAERSPSA